MGHYNLNRFYVCIYKCVCVCVCVCVRALLNMAFVHTDRNEVRQFLSKTQVKWNRKNDSR